MPTLGGLLLAPMGLALITRLAPPERASRLVALWYVATAVGAAARTRTTLRAECASILPNPAKKNRPMAQNNDQDALWESASPCGPKLAAADLDCRERPVWRRLSRP
jgi:thiol:disulfide interchange protein